MNLHWLWGVTRNGAHFQRHGIWRVSINHQESVGIQKTVTCLLEGDVIKAAEKDDPHAIVGQGDRRDNKCLKEHEHFKVINGLISS